MNLFKATTTIERERERERGWDLVQTSPADHEKLPILGRLRKVDKKTLKFADSHPILRGFYFSGSRALMDLIR